MGIDGTSDMWSIHCNPKKVYSIGPTVNKQTHSPRVTEAACMRSELEALVWSHFENVIAPEARKYHAVA